MKTYSTFLPVFTGFYCNGNFEIDLDSEIDYIHNERTSNRLPNLTDIPLETNEDKLHLDVSKAMCNYVENKFNQESDTEITIKFGELRSPREYNFGNDSINCEITCDIEKLLQICSDNTEKFETYIKERYTDCDGFWSSHSNIVSDWLNIDYINEKSEHRVGAILEFICTKLYQIEEPCLSDLDIHGSNYILNVDYWINFNPFNDEVIVCTDLENFNKACYWFRNYSGLEKKNYVPNIETLSIKFIDGGNEILKQIEISNLIDFQYTLESIYSYELK